VSEPRATAFAWVVAAYALATALGVGAGMLIAPAHPFVVAGVADAVATIVVFAASVRFDNSSFYDAYWSVAPLAIAAYFVSLAPTGPSARAVLALALLTLWGVRLTLNWARGWQGLSHEDWRYRDLRASSGRAYWVVSLFGIHLFPTVLTFVGSLSLLPITRSAAPLGALDALAALVTLGATSLEAVADEQLRAHRASGRGGICVDGVWAYARHPNYTGEIGVWLGLSLFALAAEPESLYVLAGPASMLGLFVFVSVPLAERRSLARRPGFAEHMRRVPALVPWPGRRAAQPAERETAPARER
jgi:steroid 5-alpha reductase family enzyme